ncbi:hypothetical protein [Akkermansia sp.]
MQASPSNPMNAAAGSVTTMMAIPAFRPSNAGSKSLRRGLPLPT